MAKCAICEKSVSHGNKISIARSHVTQTIVFGLTGTGYFDLKAYESYNDHRMTDVIPTDEQIAESLAKLPKVK